MPEFAYEARDKVGKLIKGTMTGDSVNAVSARLQSSGYIPIRIDSKSHGKGFTIPFLKPKVKLHDLTLFTRQLWTMQMAGLPLLSSLRSLEAQTKSLALKKAIVGVVVDVESGLSLHESLARQPEVFDELFVSMVQAGEMSGRLDDVLQRIAYLLERNMELKQKISAALRYPMITLFVLMCAFFGLIIFVVPKFEALFAAADVLLPLPTRILLATNHAIRSYWLVIIGVVALIIFLFKAYTRTKGGRYNWHAFILRLPIFGQLLHEIFMARLARNLSILIASGLPILQALDLSARTVGNDAVARALARVGSGVRDGKAMNETMRESPLFSEMVITMVAVGEETGKVDELLGRVADFYDFETDIKVKNLTTMIEPIIIVGLGAMILILALGIFMPIWNLVQVIG